MGLIKEPLEVDFEVAPKPLTQQERNAITKYILDYKQAKKHQRKTTSVRKKPK